MSEITIDRIEEFNQQPWQSFRTCPALFVVFVGATWSETIPHYLNPILVQGLTRNGLPPSLSAVVCLLPGTRETSTRRLSSARVSCSTTSGSRSPTTAWAHGRYFETRDECDLCNGTYLVPALRRETWAKTAEPSDLLPLTSPLHAGEIWSNWRRGPHRPLPAAIQLDF